MSAYRSCKTQFKQKKSLATALGKQFNGVEVLATPQKITAYGHVEHVDIKIPGKANNKYHDMGFAKVEDGTFELRASDYDPHYRDQKWLTQLAMDYAEVQTSAAAEENNCELESRERLPNGGVRLRYLVNGGM